MEIISIKEVIIMQSIMLIIGGLVLAAIIVIMTKGISIDEDTKWTKEKVAIIVAVLMVFTVVATMMIQTGLMYLIG